MIFLTRLASMGFMGLGASGLSAYFVPKYFGASSASSLMYRDREVAELDEVKFLEFIEAQKEELTQLREKYEEFKKASTGIGNSKNKKHGEVNSQLQKISREEEELESLYQEIKNMISQLEQIGTQQTKVLNNKLNVESLIESLKYYNDAMLKTGTAMTQWGGAINQILCVIKDSSGQKDCSKDDKWWVQQEMSSSSLGVSDDAEGGALRHRKKLKLS